MFITEQGMILRTQASGISIIGRATQGVRLIDMEPKTRPSRWRGSRNRKGGREWRRRRDTRRIRRKSSSPPADGEESDPKDQQ